MKNIPIRLKLSLLSATLVIVVVVTLGAFTFANFYTEQLEALDWDLGAAGRRIADLPSLDEIVRASDEMVRYEPRAAYSIFDVDGRVLGRGGEMTADLARDALKETGAITATAVADGRGWRLMAFRHERLSIVVAQNMDEVYEVMRDLIIAYALSLPFVALLCAFGVWWVAGLVLKPVRALTSAAENMQAEKLDHRVPVPLARDEVQRLALVFNSMLSRLQKSFEQARRFSADASHELRTPLTILRGEVEQLVREPGLSAAHENKLVSIQEEIARLQRTTDALLMLARLDSGGVIMRREDFDLSELVRDVCGDAELLATSRGVRLETKIADNVIVKGDAEHLRRVLLNLFDNAVKFNVRGGRVACSLSADGVFRVGNTGAGIAVEKRARLFQRFFRADESREQEREHARTPDRARENNVSGSGLGLSLSREIARAQGGELALDETASTADWTEFVLTLPPV